MAKKYTNEQACEHATEVMSSLSRRRATRDLPHGYYRLNPEQLRSLIEHAFVAGADSIRDTYTNCTGTLVHDEHVPCPEHD